LRHRVDAALEAALDAALPGIEGLHPSMAPLTAELRAFMAGGKRIRPALLLLGFEAAGGRQMHAVEGPALALELLHTCALLHDDVIDQAPTRRGRPSVHHAFATRHRTEDWHGDAQAYGRAIAILLGDLAFVQADALFLSGQVPDQVLLAAFRRFTVLREEVMVGQALDLHAATARTTDRGLSLQIATLKSGRYSVARPLELGALLAGADTELLAGLHAFGDPLGRAFQLADDLLGVFGDSATTGKSVSSDLAEGKRTLLIAEAAERLGPSDRRSLEEALGDAELDAAATQRIRELLESSGARAATEHEIERSIRAAHAALAELRLPGDASASLRAVADYLGNRKS
jgi:geranylgeranyl diphosphate synthase, type I